MAASFAERLDLTAANYVFSVVTHGGDGGAAALRQLDGILKEKAGRGLDAGFAVHMPGNYILMYDSPAGEKRDRLLAAADAGLERIAGQIRQEERPNLPNSPVARIVKALTYPWFRSHVHGNDRKFTVSEACTSCGTCASICPAGNIEMVDGRPVWNHRCELCCGCIHLCPAEAIQPAAAPRRGSATGTRTWRLRIWRTSGNREPRKGQALHDRRGISTRGEAAPAAGDNRYRETFDATIRETLGQAVRIIAAEPASPSPAPPSCAARRRLQRCGGGTNRKGSSSRR